MNDGEDALLAQKDGAVTLYYDSVAKIATTSTGVDITGTVLADAGGFGTTSPLSQLQVGGSTAVSADSKIIFGKSTASSQGYLPVIQQSSTGGLSNDLVLAATSGDGAIRMYTGASSGSGIFGTTNNAERLRIDSSGRAIIGGGITLGNGQTYSAANTLDDYEEGTWTPDVAGGGVTWLYQSGVYTKVGRLVTVTFWLQAGSTDSTTGTVSIVGLPFTTNSVGRNTVAIRAYNLANFSGNDGIVGWTSGTSTSVSINATQGGLTSGTQINRNIWTNGAEIHFSLTYMTA
jgi:hypothetical protein